MMPDLAAAFWRGGLGWVGGSKMIFGSFWNRFEIGLGLFWDRFGIVLGSFWVCFGIVLGSFWYRFGIDLGRPQPKKRRRDQASCGRGSRHKTNGGGEKFLSVPPVNPRAAGMMSPVFVKESICVVSSMFSHPCIACTQIIEHKQR